MSATSYGWLILAFPLAGTLLIGFGWLRPGGLPARLPGWIASGLEALDTRGADLGPGFGSPAEIGQLLLTRFLVPFEAASYLLLVAAVGAVVLARRRRGLEDIGALEEVGAPPDRRDPPSAETTLEVRV